MRLLVLVCLVAAACGDSGNDNTTIGGIDGDNLLSSVPAIVSDLQRIDTAWTALEQQIDQDCG